MPEDVLDEFIISGILELIVPLEKLPEVLETVLDAANHIDTVFSLDLIGRVDEDDRIPALELAESLGVFVRPNGKTNVGLGRL